MNDKFKGLVLGLSLGVMLTGSVAYASGTQIEVYFKSLKYMFDGVEKKPAADQGPGFIYNGTTYVPLRFVSEALGKEVGYDGDTGTIWVGRKVDLGKVVATYNGGQVTQGEYEKYLAIDLLVNPDHSVYLNDPQNKEEFKQYVLDHLIAYRLLSSRVTDDIKASSASALNSQLELIKKNLTAKSDNPDADYAAALNKAGVSQDELRAFIENMINGNKLIAAEFTEDKLKAEYDRRITEKTGDFVIATVRHVLISNDNADGKARTKDEIDKRVKAVQDKLNSGADFAAVAKEYTEDPGSKQNGGLYPDAPLKGFVEPFKKAAISLELNKISGPVQTDYGYHIMRVEARRTLSYDEAKSGLLNELISQRLKSFITQDVPALIQSKNLP